MKERLLTDRLAKYVALVASGTNTRDTALACGYSPSYALVIGRRTAHKPQVREAIDGIRERGRAMAGYQFAQALQDCDASIAFSRLHKNSMALVKGIELKAKLTGLLVERVETVTVNLTEALEAAKARTRRIVNQSGNQGPEGSA